MGADNFLRGATLNGEALEVPVEQPGLKPFPQDGAVLEAGPSLFKQGDNVLQLEPENAGNRANAFGVYLKGSLEACPSLLSAPPSLPSLPSLPPSAPSAACEVTDLSTGIAEWKDDADNVAPPYTNTPKPFYKPVDGDGSWIGGRVDPGKYFYKLTFSVAANKAASFKLDYLADNFLRGATLNGEALEVPVEQPGLKPFPQDGAVLEAGPSLFK